MKPQTPADANLVADPYLLQIVKRPKQRPERRAIAAFKLVTPVDAVSLAKQPAAVVRPVQFSARLEA